MWGPAPPPLLPSLTWPSGTHLCCSSRLHPTIYLLYIASITQWYGRLMKLTAFIASSCTIYKIPCEGCLMDRPAGCGDKQCLALYLALFKKSSVKNVWWTDQVIWVMAVIAWAYMHPSTSHVCVFGHWDWATCRLLMDAAYLSFSVRE